MEIKKVENIPMSNKGMNEDAQKILDTMTQMNIGETVEFKDKERSVQSMVSSVKNLSKRLTATCKFTIRARAEAVYVKKDEDITKAPKTEDKKTPEKKETPKKK